MKPLQYTLRRFENPKLRGMPRHCSFCRREPLRKWLLGDATPAGAMAAQARGLDVSHLIICLPCARRFGQAAAR